jgi:hypothetical protein
MQFFIPFYEILSIDIGLFDYHRPYIQYVVDCMNSFLFRLSQYTCRILRFLVALESSPPKNLVEIQIVDENFF